MKSSRVVQIILWVCAIGLWIITGIAGLVFFVNVLGGVWTPTGNSDRPRIDALLDNAMKVGSTSSTFAIVATVCAVGWTLYCKTQATKS